MAACSKPAIAVWRPWEVQQPASPPPPQQSLPPQSSSLSSRPQHVCRIYRFPFRRYGELKRHCDSCHVRRIRQCHICHKTFTRKDNLTRHIKNKHSTIAKSRCNYCLKVLSRKDAAARHQKTCLKNPSKQTVEDEAPPQRPNVIVSPARCK